MKKILATLISISALFILIFSCSKEDQNFSGSAGDNIRTTISGMVLDENNAAVANVNVTAYSQTTATNQYGVFVLKDVSVNKDRCIVQFTKAGYFNRSHAFIATDNTVNYVRVVLISNAQTHTVSATGGGTVTLADNSSVQFAPNSFVTTTGNAYTGTVSLTVKHLSPDAANFGFMIPGGDLAGKNLNDEDVSLYTYGMLGVELKGSSGETLQLATGTSATLTLAIAVSQQSSAPTTIPLWFFDDATSLWKEEGVATKIGNNYVGTVQHFSWWNCDVGASSPLIKGKVVDCEGVPMPNVVVTVNGWATTLTNQNGVYHGQVPSGLALTVQVLASNNGGLILNSQLENVPALTNGQTYIVPYLIVPCPSRVAGTIKTCPGENTSGVVALSNTTGFYYFQYAQYGTFDLLAFPNAQLELNAFNVSNTYHQTITSLAAPNILNIGNIFLCDTLATAVNNFTINGGPFNNRFFPVITYPNSPPYASVVIDSSGITHLYILIFGTSPPDYQVQYDHIYLSDTMPGTYLYNDLQGINVLFQDTTDDYEIHSYSGNIGSINILQIAGVNGRIIGNYSGSVAMTINGGVAIPITISGNFDVLRTQ